MVHYVIRHSTNQDTFKSTHSSAANHDGLNIINFGNLAYCFSGRSAAFNFYFCFNLKQKIKILELLIPEDKISTSFAVFRRTNQSNFTKLVAHGICTGLRFFISDKRIGVLKALFDDMLIHEGVYGFLFTKQYAYLVC